MLDAVLLYICRVTMDSGMEEAGEIHVSNYNYYTHGTPLTNLWGCITCRMNSYIVQQNLYTLLLLWSSLKFCPVALDIELTILAGSYLMYCVRYYCLYTTCTNHVHITNIATKMIQLCLKDLRLAKELAKLSFETYKLYKSC